MRTLNEDPEEKKHRPNRISREVKSGHYIRVEPVPLKDPLDLMIVSEDMLIELNLSKTSGYSKAMTRLLAGHINEVEGMKGHTWATPYALSIYG